MAGGEFLPARLFLRLPSPAKAAHRSPLQGRAEAFPIFLRSSCERCPGMCVKFYPLCVFIKGVAGCFMKVLIFEKRLQMCQTAHCLMLLRARMRPAWRHNIAGPSLAVNMSAWRNDALQSLCSKTHCLRISRVRRCLSARMQRPSSREAEVWRTSSNECAARFSLPTEINFQDKSRGMW